MRVCLKRKSKTEDGEGEGSQFANPPESRNTLKIVALGPQGAQESEGIRQVLGTCYYSQSSKVNAVSTCRYAVYLAVAAKPLDRVASQCSKLQLEVRILLPTCSTWDAQ